MGDTLSAGRLGDWDDGVMAVEVANAVEVTVGLGVVLGIGTAEVTPGRGEAHPLNRIASTAGALKSDSLIITPPCAWRAISLDCDDPTPV